MSDRVEASALIALLRSGSRPWSQWAELIEEAGSALAVLEREKHTEADTPRLFDAGAETRVDLASIEEEVAGWEAEGMRLVTILDAGYPENLRTVHDRPPFVFLAGALEERDQRSIAVVGTRQASGHGRTRAAEVAGELAADGFTIMSGLAVGIDTAAHEAALAQGARTVAVIGTGLRRAYPRENAALQERIAAEGAVVSQFWPDQPPTKTTFPLRNAVMSGLALATVVIEASYTSGARMQARIAREHGRPVFLLKALLAEHEWAREYAARPGAHVISTAAEIAEGVQRATSFDTLLA